MSSLRADLTALVRQQRAEGLKMVALDALELLLHPRHRLLIYADGSYEFEHPRACTDRPHCDLAATVATAPLLSSPHARGHAYEVWVEKGATALSFLDITGREGT